MVIFGTVFKNSSATLLARVVNADGLPLKQADIASAEYSVYLWNFNNPDAAIPVVGHEYVSIDVSSLIFDTLQTDSIWDVDQTGYNFRHVLNVLVNQAFTIANRAYLIVFELTSTSGRTILVRFRVHII